MSDPRAGARPPMTALRAPVLDGDAREARILGDDARGFLLVVGAAAENEDCWYETVAEALEAASLRGIDAGRWERLDG